ncbi:uncharacterized protein LOC117233786 [Bombus vosnesenskii]|uniref:Uncharacterized protein LOC117233786 n=1 Tax=Bombus vosnesenskii TaxID=207650 RepID=A0A6J3KBU7_9HYME|nr:uncharacterized protein LOC117233786 [Bombus vosnesenskii]
MSTNKDHAKLKEVSACFTEKTLQDILYTVHNGKEVNVLSWEFGGSSTIGDNYLSTIYKIKVTGTVDGKKVQVGLVVKALPKNKGRRKTYRSTEFFSNEILFYTKIIPKFEMFVKEKNQPQALCIPRHFASVMDGENDFIALEDVTFLGYEVIGRQNSLDEEQFKMILKSIARFHAVSLAFKDQNPHEFREIVEYLHETYYSNEHWNWYKRFHEKILDITKNALAIEYPDSEAEKRLKSYKVQDLYQKATELCNRKYHSTSVVSQGDSWIPNYMIRKITEHEALILDFQLARCASPVLDLSTTFYSCTDKALWDEKFDILLQFYYNELFNTIALLGSDPRNIYSWDMFMNEVKEQFVFGMIFAMEIIQMALLDESEAFDLDLIKDDNGIDIADIWTLSYIKTKEGRLKLANIIVHAVEKGFF